jgi:hypothetical protein
MIICKNLPNDVIDVCPIMLKGVFVFFGVVKRNLIDDNENWLIANGCFNGD